MSVSDENRPAGTNPHDGQSTGWIVLGVALVVVGVVLGARQLGILPWPLIRGWSYLVKARGGVGIVLLGILLILWTQSGHRFTAPAHGTKLYRSREDKWLAGVLGGLAQYLSVDVTLLRLVFIALVVLFDAGALVVVYIVLAIVVPVEPEAGYVAPATAPAPAPVVPAPPQAPAPSAEPAPPAPASGEAQPEASSGDTTTRA
jgi:phage shock protein C